MSGTLTETLIEQFLAKGGSDLYLVCGARPSALGENGFTALRQEPMKRTEIEEIMQTLVPAAGLEEFASVMEYNTAIDWKNGQARLRINLFQQRQMPGVVVRRIHTRIPNIDELRLPRAYAQMVMEKRGLVLIVGPTGSGKSTSIAAMIGYRNRHGSGHIVTVEDPVEFVHEHQGCLISQRDVGVDTLSFDAALKNALRQSPDVIVIGEIRDAGVMENALSFAETGHLVIATLHATNASQAIERIVSFFPQDKQRQALLMLSLNLRGVFSQRLVHTGKKRVLAVEILLNQGLIKDLIAEGKIRDIRDMIEKSRDQGMQSFDQALFDLSQAGEITEEMAMAECDNPANLRVLLKQVDMQRKLSAMKADGRL